MWLVERFVEPALSLTGVVVVVAIVRSAWQAGEVEFDGKVNRHSDGKVFQVVANLQLCSLRSFQRDRLRDLNRVGSQWCSASEAGFDTFARTFQQ